MFLATGLEHDNKPNFSTAFSAVLILTSVLVCSLDSQGGLQRVRANLQSRVKKGAMSQSDLDKAMSLLKGELTYDNFKVRAGLLLALQ